MLIKSGIDKTLYFVAALKSSFKIDIKPRVRPHPKQGIPSRLLTRHIEQENIFDRKHRTLKKAHPAHKVCKVCLFLLEILLNLNQRIAIAISKTA